MLERHISCHLQHKLLTTRTVQAHCTYLDTPSFSRLHHKGTSIAHCPLSNAYFSAEPFHLREALKENVKVGLGTDVAGGYSLDIMNTMRHAVTVSKIRQGSNIMARASIETSETHDLNLAVDWKESLYLATTGGALALGLPAGSGVFQPKAPFDAQCSELSDFSISWYTAHSGSSAQFAYLTQTLASALDPSIFSISRLQLAEIAIWIAESCPMR